MEKPLAENRFQTSVEEDQTAAQDRRAKGEFVRGVSGFRYALDDIDFPAVPNRYHLFVALNCPWCHRVTLARNILGLQNSITLDILFPNRTDEEDSAGPNLWQFAPERLDLRSVVQCHPHAVFWIRAAHASWRVVWLPRGLQWQPMARDFGTFREQCRCDCRGVVDGRIVA